MTGLLPVETLPKGERSGKLVTSCQCSFFFHPRLMMADRQSAETLPLRGASREAKLPTLHPKEVTPMCIIAAKPRGIAMPDEKTLKNMWGNNPDGAGIMWSVGDGVVHIEKGYMKQKNFLAAIDDLDKTVDLTDAAVVIHCRITTHGGTCAENTHPFPVSDSVGRLKKLRLTCPLGVAHNGIISSVTPRKNISDTMEYIASQLAPLYKAVPDFYKNPHLMEMISNAISSKMAFLSGKGEIYTIGSFLEEDDILYSNYSYAYSNSWRSAPYSYYDGASKKWLTDSAAKHSSAWHDYYDSGCGTDLSRLDALSALDADEDDCPEDEYGDYDYAPLMALDETAGEYVIDDKGELKDGDDYFVDEDGNVYKYLYTWDACRLKSGATAHTVEGLPLRFDPDRACDELILTDICPRSDK